MGPPDLPDVIRRLRVPYPTARYELDWDTPVQMLVATILAAQCTDERVNRVTAELFPRFYDAAAIAAADPAELESIVRATGYFRQKTRAIQGACAALVERHGGEVPPNLEQLVALPGVARKTANVVLATCFDLPSGVIVDTHVKRVCQRLGLTGTDDPDALERELMAALPVDQWTWFGPALVLHGRYTCTARKPACASCALEPVCPRIGV